MELMPNTDDMIVTLDNEQIVMRDGTTSLQLSAPMAQGRLRISWELFRPNFGNTITIQTDLLRFTVYRTDKGSLDKGGLPQPAFLNFDAELLYPVAHTMQGIVGEGYTRVLNGKVHSLPNDGTFMAAPMTTFFLATSLRRRFRKHTLPTGGCWRPLLGLIRLKRTASWQLLHHTWTPARSMWSMLAASEQHLLRSM